MRRPNPLGQRFRLATGLDKSRKIQPPMPPCPPQRCGIGALAACPNTAFHFDIRYTINQFSGHD
jgi:hypothetical protein